MNEVIRFYRLLNTLSIDVAFGAVVSAYFIGYLESTSLSFAVSFCLGLTVWLIYTVDHLLDARKIKIPASTYRHRFHQLHFKALLICVSIVLLLIFLLLFEISKPILVGGIVLTIFVVMYFISLRWLGFMKEVFGAILYSTGVLLPTIALVNTEHYHVLPIIMFVVTALINLILFSWFDLEKDKNQNHTSLASVLGDLNTRSLLYSLFVVQLSLSTYCLALLPHVVPFIAVLVGMNATLLIIFFNWKWFSSNDRYRLAGDAIFLFPLLFFWI